MTDKTKTVYRIRHEVSTPFGWINIYLRREHENSYPTWVTKASGASEYSKGEAIGIYYTFGGVIEEVTLQGSDRKEINCSVLNV